MAVRTIARLWAGAGFRTRLSVLVLHATAPLFALLLASALMQRRDAIDTAHTRLLEMARTAANQADDSTQEAANLLQVLRRVPVLQRGSLEDCHAMMREIVNDHPRIDSMSIIRPDGTAACNSSQPVPDFSVADRKWFVEASAPDAPRIVFSDLVISRVNGRPTVVIASPLPAAAEGAASPGVLSIGLNLGWFSQTFRQISSDDDAAALIVNLPSATIIAHHPDPKSWVGRSLPAHPLIAALRRGQAGSGEAGGVVEAQGLDGVVRMFGTAALPGIAGGGTVVAIGLSREAVLRDANFRLGVEVALALTMCVLALGLAWRIARSSVVMPLVRLGDATDRIGHGDLDATAAMSAGDPPEFRRFGQTLEAMARTLKESGQDVAAAQAVIARNEELYRLLTESSVDVVVQLDPSFRRTYVSPASLEVLGYAPDELLGGDARMIVHPEDWPRFSAVLASLSAGMPRVSIIYRAVRKDLATIWVEGVARRLESGGVVVTIRDVTRRRLAEEQLEVANRQLAQLATSDGLTGLLNRRGFDEAIGLEYRTALRLGTPLALIMIDVDYFKSYNDSYGHPAGDCCLRDIAHAIDRRMRRPRDLAARYGGEEFAVILPGTDEEQAMIVADEIRRSVESEGLAHRGSPIAITTVSMGVGAFSPGADDGGPAKLVEMADAALYAAKRAGRNTARAASLIAR